MDDVQVRDQLRKFVDERDWRQFHTPESLAKSISIEAAELLECFQWNSEGDRDAARMELADVLTYAFLLADALGESPHDLIVEKLALTKAKYPVDRAFGKATKYDQL